MNREKLASRIGFIFLSAGCAIGIGNVWRFPYICGQNGGGWFVAIYLFFLVILGLPVMIMEFAAGRGAQRSIAKLHDELSQNKVWSIHGLAGTLGATFLMMFYTSVAGWMVIYLCKSAAGSFVGLDAAAVGGAFGAMLGDWKLQTVAMVGVSVGAAAVIAVGLQKGLERVSKVMMVALLVLIVVLAVRSVLLPGAAKGLDFYLVPSLERMRSVGIGKVVVEAMNHAFFTLSLGIGAMAIFGSYIDKKRTLFGEAANVAVLDTIVAISAGLIIFPACFAYGVEPGQGPGLIFATLPNVFNQMPFGRLWGSLFFLFMSFAALTTVLAVFETILGSLVDYTGMSRRKAALLLGLVVPLLSMPCILGFSVWSGFEPFGKGSCVLDLEDFVVSDLLLPLGSLAFALFCCHRYGWGWEKFLAETNAGSGPKLSDRLRVYCAYVLPVIILSIFVIGLLKRFGFLTRFGL